MSGQPSGSSSQDWEQRQQSKQHPAPARAQDLSSWQVQSQPPIIPEPQTGPQSQDEPNEEFESAFDVLLGPRAQENNRRYLAAFPPPTHDLDGREFQFPFPEPTQAQIEEVLKAHLAEYARFQALPSPQDQVEEISRAQFEEQTQQRTQPAPQGSASQGRRPGPKRRQSQSRPSGNGQAQSRTRPRSPTQTRARRSRPRNQPRGQSQRRAQPPSTPHSRTLPAQAGNRQEPQSRTLPQPPRSADQEMPDRPTTPDPLDSFVSWTRAVGASIDSICPTRLPGRGVGMVAVRDIKKDEVVLRVPNVMLRTLETIPNDLLNRTPHGTTQQCIIALHICMDKSLAATMWRSVLPSMVDMKVYMPILWDEQLHSQLPPTGRALLERQKENFKRDWSVSKALHPPLSRSEYLHAWLLVNTRSFFRGPADLTQSRIRGDKMALIPLADLFNHSDEGCAFEPYSEPEWCVFRAKRSYKVGEEVFLRYGRHGNDFLMVEYGFTFDDNSWDEASLQDVIEPRLTEAQKVLMCQLDYFGAFVMSRAGTCFRTKLAVQAMLLDPERWRALYDPRYPNREDPEAADIYDVMFRDQSAIAATISMLEEYKRDLVDRDVLVMSNEDGSTPQRERILARWRQVLAVIDMNLGSLKEAVICG